MTFSLNPPNSPGRHSVSHKPHSDSSGVNTRPGMFNTTPPSPHRQPPSHTRTVGPEGQRGEGTCSRSLRALVPGPQSWDQDPVSVLCPRPSLSTALHHTLGTVTLQVTLHRRYIQYKGEGLLVWKTKSSSKKRKKKSAGCWGASEKGRQPSPALGLECDKRGVPDSSQLGCRDTPGSGSGGTSASSWPRARSVQLDSMALTAPFSRGQPSLPSVTLLHLVPPATECVHEKSHPQSLPFSRCPAVPLSSRGGRPDPPQPSQPQTPFHLPAAERPH